MWHADSEPSLLVESLDKFRATGPHPLRQLFLVSRLARLHHHHHDHCKRGTDTVAMSGWPNARTATRNKCLLLGPGSGLRFTSLHPSERKSAVRLSRFCFDCNQIRGNRPNGANGLADNCGTARQLTSLASLALSTAFSRRRPSNWPNRAPHVALARELM